MSDQKYKVNVVIYPTPNIPFIDISEHILILGNNYYELCLSKELKDLNTVASCPDRVNISIINELIQHPERYDEDYINQLTIYQIPKIAYDLGCVDISNPKNNEGEHFDINWHKVVTKKLQKDYQGALDDDREYSYRHIVTKVVQNTQDLDEYYNSEEVKIYRYNREAIFNRYRSRYC